MMPTNDPVHVGPAIDTTQGPPQLHWSNGPDSNIIGKINCFGGNQWGDTVYPHTAGLWTQGPSIPRAAQAPPRPVIPVPIDT